MPHWVYSMHLSPDDEAVMCWRGSVFDGKRQVNLKKLNIRKKNTDHVSVGYFYIIHI